MNKWIKVGVVVMAVLLQACAASLPKTAVDYKPDYDFSTIKTYAFARHEYSAGDSLSEERIEKNIELQMQQRGIKQVALEEADVSIKFLLATENKQDIRTYSSGYYGGGYRCYRCAGSMMMPTTDVRVVDYTQGTLVIDFVDSALKRTVWHGVSQGKIHYDKTPAERDESARLVIENMLLEFPPKPDMKK